MASLGFVAAILFIVAFVTLRSQTMDVSERVAQHILVPSSTPVAIQQIKDIAQARSFNPEFFRQAALGDFVLRWPNLSVLYSPSKDVVVATTASDQATPDCSPTTTIASLPASLDTPTIDIRNGTRKNGLANTLGQLLDEKGFQIGTVGDTPTKSWKFTHVIFPNAAQSFSTEYQSLADILAAYGGTFSSTSTLRELKMSDITNRSLPGLGGDIVIVIGEDIANAGLLK